MADVAQLCQAVVFSRDDRVQGLEHQTVCILVEIELHSQAVGIGNLCQGLCRGEGHDHTVLFDETDLCHELHVGEHATGILLEEAYGFARLELMLHVEVGGATQFHYELVQTVIIGTAYREGKPAHATAHFFLYTHVLCLALKLFLLELVFLQQ